MRSFFVLYHITFFALLAQIASNQNCLLRFRSAYRFYLPTLPSCADIPTHSAVDKVYPDCNTSKNIHGDIAYRFDPYLSARSSYTTGNK